MILNQFRNYLPNNRVFGINYFFSQSLNQKGIIKLFNNITNEIHRNIDRSRMNILS
jgi:hypothetical protein